MLVHVPFQHRPATRAGDLLQSLRNNSHLELLNHPLGSAITLTFKLRP